MGLSNFFYEKNDRNFSETALLPSGDEQPPRNMLIAGSLVVIAAIVIICAGIKAAQSIVGPFCLAGFLAVILTAPQRWLKTKGFSDTGSALIVSSVVLLCGMSIIWILAGSVNQFVNRIPVYSQKFSKTIKDIDDYLEPYGLSLQGGTKEKPINFIQRRFLENGLLPTGTLQFQPNTNVLSEPNGATVSISNFPEKNLNTTPVIPSIQDGTSAENSKPDQFESDPNTSNSTNSSIIEKREATEKKPNEVNESKNEMPHDFDSRSEEIVHGNHHFESAQKDSISPSILPSDLFSNGNSASTQTVGIAGYIRWGAGELGKLAVICFIVMILIVFMILDSSRIARNIHRVFGTRGHQGKTHKSFQKIVDKIWKYMLIKSIISFCVGLFAWILLIVNGVDYALLWALVAFFLNFIPNIGSVIAAIPPVAIAFFDHGLPTCIIVTIGYLIINQTLGYYIEPIFLGDGLGIPPLVILISLIFWGWLLGLIGMFLAAPLTIVLKIILDSFDETRWASMIMDGPSGEFRIDEK
ncbi:MAG: AI-2E family transporter [Thermoguttaceae bacterium]